MSEKIVYVEHRKTLVGWALIAAIGQQEVMTSMFRANPKGEVEVEVSLTIDGRPYSFIQVLKRMEESIDHEVRIKAEALILERMEDLNQLFETLRRDVKVVVRKRFPEINFDEECW